MIGHQGRINSCEKKEKPPQNPDISQQNQAFPIKHYLFFSCFSAKDTLDTIDDILLQLMGQDPLHHVAIELLDTLVHDFRDFCVISTNNDCAESSFTGRPSGPDDVCLSSSHHCRPNNNSMSSSSDKPINMGT